MKNVTLSLLFLFILFSACKKNSLSDIANRPYSQFENSTVEGAVTKVRFEDTDILINFILENDTLPDFFTTTLSVNLFGAPLNHDVIIDYEIIDTMGIKLNREFTLSDTKFIIPAGSLTGSIDITIYKVPSLIHFIKKIPLNSIKIVFWIMKVLKGYTMYRYITYKMGIIGRQVRQKSKYFLILIFRWVCLLPDTSCGMRTIHYRNKSSIFKHRINRVITYIFIISEI